MKPSLLIASGLVVTALAALQLPAHAKTLKECAAEWDQMKAAGQTAGMKYRDFSKKCMSGEAAPAGTTPAESPKPAATAPAATPTPAGKPSPGREAMIARERACGAEWKADKAAGKIPAGMTWPKYWSACDKRKKAAGM